MPRDAIQPAIAIAKSADMKKTRTETDTFGPIEVDATRYWGAQAQRSLDNFKIGWEKQPQPVIRALGIVKRAAPRPTWRWAASTRPSARPSSPPRRK